VYVSGQIGLTTEMKLVGETIEEQTTQVMKNMGAILEAAGASFDDVVRCTIFMANMDDFKAVNGIYGESA
jgi:2-iminobutanoate/2-iminopropanoate deaminase